MRMVKLIDCKKMFGLETGGFTYPSRLLSAQLQAMVLVRPSLL
jgi:hypothetical protein